VKKYALVLSLAFLFSTVAQAATGSTKPQDVGPIGVQDVGPIGAQDVGPIGFLDVGPIGVLISALSTLAL
jgi:hypothetical protein